MALTATTKNEIVTEYGRQENDTGSPEVQVAIMTKNIAAIQAHLQDNKGDNHSRRGLQNLVAKRRRMLDYLKAKDLNRYTTLITKLGIRR